MDSQIDRYLRGVSDDPLARSGLKKVLSSDGGRLVLPNDQPELFEALHSAVRKAGIKTPVYFLETSTPPDGVVIGRYNPQYSVAPVMYFNRNAQSVLTREELAEALSVEARELFPSRREFLARTGTGVASLLSIRPVAKMMGYIPELETTDSLIPEDTDNRMSMAGAIAVIAAVRAIPVESLLNRMHDTELVRTLDENGETELYARALAKMRHANKDKSWFAKATHKAQHLFSGAFPLSEPSKQH